MTIDERLNRIEHWTAGMAEERRRDREETRALWRETQEQIMRTQRHLDEFIIQSREADDRLRERIEASDRRIEASDREAKERDRLLGERIDRLVSGIGEFIAREKGQ